MRKNLIWISILFICVAAGCSSKPKAGQAPVPPSGAAAGVGAPTGAAAPAATTNSPAVPANGKAPAQAPNGPAPAKPSTGPVKQAAVAADAAKMQVACVRDADERLIEIVEAQPKGCSLYYTKSGERSSIASSANGSGHCESVRDRMRKNLEEAGYKCGDHTAKVAGPQAPAKSAN